MAKNLGIKTCISDILFNKLTAEDLKSFLYEIIWNNSCNLKTKKQYREIVNWLYELTNANIINLPKNTKADKRFWTDNLYNSDELFSQVIEKANNGCSKDEVYQCFLKRAIYLLDNDEDYQLSIAGHQRCLNPYSINVENYFDDKKMKKYIQTHQKRMFEFAQTLIDLLILN